jgi:hypothetical protein
VETNIIVTIISTLASITSWIIQDPSGFFMLLVWATGIFLSIKYWHRNPQKFLLTLVACSLFIVQQIAFPLVIDWWNSFPDESRYEVYSTFQVAQALLSAVWLLAWVILFYSIFSPKINPTELARNPVANNHNYSTNDPQNDSKDKVILESLSSKHRILNAVIGLFAGSIFFMPVLFLLLEISISISTQYGFNTNTDEFMAGYFCFLPSALISLIGGIIGGEIGNKNNHKYLGAIFGGLVGPIATLIPLSINILNSWAEH